MTTNTFESNQLPIIIKESFKSELKNTKLRFRYTIELLCDIIERDNCGIDVFFYENRSITGHTIIDFICNCGERGNKIFENLYKNGGGFCKKCTRSKIGNKIKETNLKIRGVEYSMQDKIVKNKSKQTCLEKYGVENSMQSEIFKEKSKQTCLEKYGVENPMQCEIFKEKYKKVCLKKYGVENPMQCEIFKEKSKQTCLEKYGVENPMQHPEIAEKSQLNSYIMKEYLLPSGNILLYQGYENFTLDELIFLEGINEDDITTSKKDVPEIWYKDTNGVSHRYYTDIYIKSQNKCIEVKSGYTSNINPEIIHLKEEAVKKNGYEYEIRIYDNKKNKLL